MTVLLIVRIRINLNDGNSEIIFLLHFLVTGLQDSALHELFPENLLWLRPYIYAAIYSEPRSDVPYLP
jgi:hypothetical protein